eukprot:TRINITY_DN55172_c0_g1_i1.p1 TRINITY_DN55172_c0_g1~~TRINITY_DN55172_c0_g1_i1.p1  ORF type:complete len:487 (-),score=36.61 TRINITY_DN55172_c0_g1_i1:333-1793(-)
MGEDGCQACSAGHWASLFLSIGLIPVLVLVIYASSSNIHSWRGDPAEAVGMAVELFIELAQVVGVLTLTSIEWPAALGQLFDISGFFEFVVPLHCLFGSLPNASIQYFGSLLTVPLVCLTAWVLWALSRICPCGRVWSAAKVQNVCGKVLATLFVSQITLCMLPFMCYAHPNGQDMSVLEFAGTICGTSDHIIMIIIAAFATGVCLAFIAYCTLKVYRMKQIVMAHDAHHQLEKILYIVEDFSTGNAVTFLWLKLKELLLSFVLVVEPSDSRIQVAYFYTILLGFTMFTCRTFPFKLPYFNFMDVVLHSIMLSLLCLGKDYIPNLSVEKYVESQMLVVIAGVALALCFITILLVPILNRLVRRGTGELWPIMNLGSYPTEDSLEALWQKVNKIGTDELHNIMLTWSVYDFKNFVACLLSLKPGLSTVFASASTAELAFDAHPPSATLSSRPHTCQDDDQSAARSAEPCADDASQSADIAWMGKFSL